MSTEIVIPKEVKAAVARGQVLRGVREYAEQEPDGTWVMKIGPSSPVRYAPWRGRTDGKGMKATADGQHMFRLKASETRPVSLPAEAMQAMRDSLPAIVRRSAAEKYRDLVGTLYRDGLQHFTAGGEVRWPASVEREISIIGAAQGRPTLLAQVEALASRFIVKAAREQQAQDAKQVTRTWHGHVSA